MVKKLSVGYVLDNLNDANCHIEDGVDKGLVENSTNRSDDAIRSDLYDIIFSSPDSKYDLWADLLICRSFDTYKNDRRALFSEIADIYELFGCPKNLSSLVYFEPADSNFASEQTLFDGIASYSERAKDRLRLR